MKTPHISIIIPVYNTEVYLVKCLNSVINQTFQNIEVIVVDDGSLGNCKDICSQYPQILYTSYAENRGSFYAREHGTRLAHGKYIVYLDSDDWLPLNICEHIFHAGDFDLLLSEVVSVYPHHTEKSRWANKGLKKVDFYFFDHYTQRDYISWSLWGKVFDRELSLRIYDKLSINDHLIMSEDYLFFTAYSSQAKQIKAIFYSGYYYNLSNESVNRTEVSQEKLEKHFHDLKIVIESSRKFLGDRQSAVKTVEKELLLAFLYRFTESAKGRELLTPFIAPILELYGKEAFTDLIFSAIEVKRSSLQKVVQRIEHTNFPCKRTLSTGIRVIAGKLRSFWASH